MYYQQQQKQQPEATIEKNGSLKPQIQVCDHPDFFPLES